MTTGVARSLEAGTSQNNIALTEIINTQKLQLFTEFRFISFHYWKFVKSQNFFFSFNKFMVPSILPTLNSASWGDYTTAPLVVTPMQLARFCEVGQHELLTTC
jgi:hypothetical protein